MRLRISQQNIALALFNLGAIQFGAFKLKLHEAHPEAPLSPIYLNLRTSENPKPGPLGSEIMDSIGRQLALVASLDKLEFDHVMGIPNAGDPFAKAFIDAYESQGQREPTLLTMTKDNLEGDKRRIGTITEGEFEPGDTVLLIDDLITKADSKLEAIGRAKEAGLVVKDVLVLVDREQGGFDQLKDWGFNLHSALRISDILNFYVEQEMITVEKAGEVLEYIRNN